MEEEELPSYDGDRWVEVTPPNTSANANGVAVANGTAASGAAAEEDGSNWRFHATAPQKARLFAIIAEADPSNVS